MSPGQTWDMTDDNSKNMAVTAWCTSLMERDLPELSPSTTPLRILLSFSNDKTNSSQFFGTTLCCLCLLLAKKKVVCWKQHSGEICFTYLLSNIIMFHISLNLDVFDVNYTPRHVCVFASCPQPGGYGKIYNYMVIWERQME